MKRENYIQFSLTDKQGRNLISIGLLLLLTNLVSAKVITDMTGRRVNVPDRIKKILPYDSKISILLFPVASDLMVAKALLPGSIQYKFIDAKYNTMPQVDPDNLEEVLVYAPEVIVAGVYSSNLNYQNFEKFQRRTGIPVILVNLSINKLDKTYLFLGKLLGKEQVCNERALFLKTVYSQSQNLIKQDTKHGKRIYYCLGNTGLLTDPAGSKHTEVLDYLKLDNVAKIPVPNGGHAKVNMEQVLTWNPEYVLAAGFKGNKNAFTVITSGGQWATVKAVQNNHVFKVPAQPFGWLDHPPSVNRIPGIIWLSEIFYDLPKEKATEQIKTFYSLFYGYKLSDAEFKTLFK